MPRARVVAAHGNFDAASCLDCRAPRAVEAVRAAVFAGETPRCAECGGLVKPDIVFFGENLPERFYDLAEEDFPAADLLIVMGTSLVVHPFADLIGEVCALCFLRAASVLLFRTPVSLECGLARL